MPEYSPGRNALITGGTDGIGKEIALGLARWKHRLILVGRDVEKGLRAAHEILSTTGSPGVRFIQADLSLVSEANRLAKEVALHFEELHYLVHSAGVVRGWRELTAEGVESNFAINFLARFAMTQNLLPLLGAAGKHGRAARILIIGGAARYGRIHFDDVNLTKKFSTVRAVAQFCRANDVFTEELSRRLALNGHNGRITVNCLKLGVVKTNIRRTFPRWMKWLVPLLLDPVLGQTPQEAAESAVRLLLSSEFERISGALFLKIKKFKTVMPSATPRDPEIGRQLWELSERLVSHGSLSPQKRPISISNEK